MRKVYISQIDSQIGAAVAQLLRDDHLHAHGSTLLLGSARQINHHPGIDAHLIQPHLQHKAALECDTIILNLRDATDTEVSTILQLLSIEIATPIQMKERKHRTVIGISTHLTWVNTPSCCHSSQDYKLRLPNGFFSGQHSLEEQILRLQSPYIHNHVICSGVVYGTNNAQLSTIIEDALENIPIEVIGKGDNLIPIIHVEDLAQIVVEVHQREMHPSNSNPNSNPTNSNPNPPPPYLLASQPPITQLDMLSIIKEQTGNTHSMLHFSMEYITKHQLIFGSSLSFTHSPYLPPPTHCFQKQAGKLLPDFYMYTEGLTGPRQSYIIVQEYKTWLNKEQVLSSLPGLIFTHNQAEDIEQQLRQSGPQMSKNELLMLAQAYDRLLQPHTLHNYTLLIPLQHVPFLMKPLPRITASPNSPSDIALFSASYYSYFKLQPPIQKEAPSEAPPCLKEQTTIAPKEENILEQYLLDKVLVHIAEGKLRLKESGLPITLSNLISQLKAIFAGRRYVPVIE